MAATMDRSASQAAGTRSSGLWLMAAARCIAGAMAERWRSRRDVHALAMLDERGLADIGLCRLDVERLVPRNTRGVMWELR